VFKPSLAPWERVGVRVSAGRLALILAFSQREKEFEDTL
jgi:hypothetical protein